MNINFPFKCELFSIESWFEISFNNDVNLIDIRVEGSVLHDFNDHSDS